MMAIDKSPCRQLNGLIILKWAGKDKKNRGQQRPEDRGQMAAQSRERGAGSKIQRTDDRGQRTDKTTDGREQKPEVRSQRLEGSGP
jgi:hypothetical protein